MPNPTPLRSKTLLRRTMRDALRRAPLDSATINEAIGRWLYHHPTCRNIAIFSPLPGEPDLTPLLKAHPNIRWHFPKVDGPNLSFHWITDPAAELEPGNFGILEPETTRPKTPVEEIDAFFCPGMAFERSGARLGRGAGFYDRMLTSSRRDALKVGICFPCQIVNNTFSEAHDIPMDAVISG